MSRRVVKLLVRIACGLLALLLILSCVAVFAYIW